MLTLPDNDSFKYTTPVVLSILKGRGSGALFDWAKFKLFADSKPYSKTLLSASWP